MSYRERKKIIEKIEKMRETKVITYVVSTRPNINTDIEVEDLRFFYNHLRDETFAGKDIDLFIYSYGGDASMAWALPKLIRSIGKQFSVLVASYAINCATSIALGADEIVMTKMGFLGLTYSTAGGYLNSIDIRKLLALHMDPKNEATKIDNIVSNLVEKSYSRYHHINREEARGIGLRVKNAEDTPLDISQLMWELFLDYEEEMKMLIPVDELPEKDLSAKIILKKIESTVTECTNINEQKWVHLDLPEGCLPVKNPDTNRECIFHPPDQKLHLNVPGKLVFWENKIYNLRDNIYWKSR
jgi:hypothetical protein